MDCDFKAVALFGHQPPFFHPKEGKDNSFFIISSKLSLAHFLRTVYKSKE
jgi:hypothetical protein